MNIADRRKIFHEHVYWVGREGNNPGSVCSVIPRGFMSFLADLHVHLVRAIGPLMTPKDDCRYKRTRLYRKRPRQSWDQSGGP
jgi:hypothetical protein